MTKKCSAAKKRHGGGFCAQRTETVVWEVISKNLTRFQRRHSARSNIRDRFDYRPIRLQFYLRTSIPINPTKVGKEIWERGRATLCTLHTLYTSLSQGKKESSAPPQGKGKRSGPPFAFEFHWSTRPRAGAHERNETKRFPGWAHPPTSDS